MIYIEDEVADHWRTHEICSRLPDAARVPCDSYLDVFERPAQDFRLQKRRPSMILAKKERDLVTPAPPGFDLGARHNYTFSPMLNCIYDCRFCYLQGMFRSASYVVFLNYEDFMSEIAATLERHPGEDVWFFSGYDCDSLALEPVTRFARTFLPFFAEQPRAWLELRTKSTQVKPLLDAEPLPNVVTAFSMTPPDLAHRLEHDTPAVERRLDSAARLQQAGWKVGLRFDPLIPSEDFRASYRALFDLAFDRLDAARLHSVTLGPFRLHADWWRRMAALYPEEPLLRGALDERDGMVGLPEEQAAELAGFCTEELARRVPAEILFPDAGPV